jgi:hypothetical protein
LSEIQWPSICGAANRIRRILDPRSNEPGNPKINVHVSNE